MNEPGGTYSHWIEELRAGNADAIQRLWDEFYPKLVNIASNQIASAGAGPVVNGEEVVTSVFESIWGASLKGRLQNVADMDEMSWMLLAMTRRKCVDHIRRMRAVRRGGDREHFSLDASQENGQSVLSAEPGPFDASSLNDQFVRILEQLPSDELRKITVQKMQGASITEIATQMGITASSVRRKLKIIWQYFENQFGQDADT